MTENKTAINRDEFIDWLKLRSLSPRSIANYLYYFDRFDIGSFLNVVPYPYNFINTYKNNDIARAFVTNFFSFIKKYPTVPAHIKEYVKQYDFDLPKKIKKQKKLFEQCSEEDVKAISSACKPERDALMVLVTFYGGLRDCELVGDEYRYIGIKAWDFNWRYWVQHPSEIGRLRILGKGDKQRVVYMPPFVMKRLYQWIRSRSSTFSKDSKLFNIKTRRWADILSNASQKAIGRHINPHLLRKSCSLWLRDVLSMDLDERREYLGHESVQITDKSYNKTNPKMRSKFDKFMV